MYKEVYKKNAIKSEPLPALFTPHDATVAAVYRQVNQIVPTQEKTPRGEPDLYGGDRVVSQIWISSVPLPQSKPNFSYYPIMPSCLKVFRCSAQMD